MGIWKSLERHKYIIMEINNNTNLMRSYLTILEEYVLHLYSSRIHHLHKIF